MNTLQHKRVLLTGATGGIGRAMLGELTRAGAEVVITGRDASALTELHATAPDKIRTFAADLTDHAALQALYQYCTTLGGLDVLINNAGISQFSAEQQQDYAALIQTNLLAPMQLTQLLLPLIQQRRGSVLMVGSTFGSIGYAGFTGYCASKFGLRGYTEALRRELHNSDVKVLYLAPRATKTAINSPAVDAMNKALGQGVDSPEQVAKAMLRQLERGSARCYLGAAENVFIRLNGLFPALVDRALGAKLKQIKQFFTTANA
ncbi:SDR family oxidoreductase [Rheinheimera sp. FR7-31]|uniref:SDR family oxidoreductase n=1 Tax=Rheinheimera fenheensis TaxID=3152295 RepID=UPI00325C7002